MKKMFSIVVAAFFAATTLFAQRSVPALELQLVYGLGDGGLQYKNSSTLTFNYGGFCVGASYNFNSHWGVVSGVELALLQGAYDADLLYSSELVYPENIPSPDPVVVTNRFEDYSETQFLSMLQVPVLVKYMMPLGKSKHDIYFAAGPKIGICINKWSSIGQNASKVSYDLDDKDGYNFIEIQSPAPARDGNPDMGLNIALSLEAGVRLRFTKFLGLYGGLFCDFGLNNPYKASGTPLYVNTPDRLSPNPAAANDGHHDKLYSILEASSVSTDLPIEDSGRYNKHVHTLIFGAKARLFFGLFNK